jgi:hypothetical protein
MSEPALWHAWFHLWGVMILASLALFAASLIVSGFHVVRYVIKTPRRRPLLSLLCVFVTVANCYFAGHVLVMMQPDA